MDLPGIAAAEVVGALEEDLQYADNPGVVEFDSRITHRHHGDGQSDALEQREVDLYVKPLGLEVAKRSCCTVRRNQGKT